MYEIREMTLQDYEKAYELWRETEGIGLSESDSKAAIASYLKRNRGFSFVCDMQGDVVGTVLCGHDGRRGFIYHAAVAEKCRGQGIGKQLIHRALESLKSAGILKCHLMVLINNQIGELFWENSGWQRRNDIVIYSKNL